MEMDLIDGPENSLTCRTCLVANSAGTGFVHLDSSMVETLSFLDCLNFCTNVGATTSDGLPVYICVDCSQALEISYEFVKKSKNANDILRENLGFDVDYEKECQRVEEGQVTTQEFYASYGVLVADDIDDDIKFQPPCDEPNIYQSNLNVNNVTEESRWNIKSDAEQTDTYVVEGALNTSWTVRCLVESPTNDIIEETQSNGTKTTAIKNMEEGQPTEWKWKCKICGKHLTSRSYYEAHINKHFGTNPFRCDLCIYQCRYRQSLKRHYKTKHGGIATIEQLDPKIEFTDVTESNVWEAAEASDSEEENTPTTRTNKLIDENSYMEIGEKNDVMPVAPDIINETLTYDISFKTPTSTLQIPQQFRGDNKDKMKEVSSFRCVLCPFICKFKWSIVRHYKGKHKKKPTDEMLKPHIEYVKKPEATEVNTPKQESVESQNELSEKDLNPKDVVNAVIGYECPKCSYAARSKQLVTKHLEEQHFFIPNLRKDPVTSHACEECKLKFRSKSLLEEHIKKMHPNGKQYNAFVKCDICGKECRAIRFSSHRRNHRSSLWRNTKKPQIIEDKTFLCSFCPKQFPNQHKLIFHEKYSHAQNSEKRFHCDQCPSKFICQYYLTQHKKTVHIQRKFKCYICGHLFKLQSQLREHLKRHTERIYRCHVCEKSYIRPLELKIHMRTHTGEKPFKCTMCSESFVLKTKLNSHFSACHLNQTTKCPYCEKEFKGGKNSQYYTHIYRHTGMPYKCEHCSSEHEKKENMRRHMKSVHKIDITDEELIAMYQANTGKFARKRLQHKKEELEVQEQLDNILFEIEDELEKYVSI